MKSFSTLILSRRLCAGEGDRSPPAASLGVPLFGRRGAGGATAAPHGDRGGRQDLPLAPRELEPRPLPPPSPPCPAPVPASHQWGAGSPRRGTPHTALPRAGAGNGNADQLSGTEPKPTPPRAPFLLRQRGCYNRLLLQRLVCCSTERSSSLGNPGAEPGITVCTF